MLELQPARSDERSILLNT